MCPGFSPLDPPLCSDDISSLGTAVREESGTETTITH